MTKLFTFLVGRFDSFDQAQSDESYYAVQMRHCAVAIPELGSRILYVEQAMMSALDAPYRQRIYVLDNSDEEGYDVSSKVFELVDDELQTSMVGYCDSEELQHQIVLNANDVEEKEGCGVHLHWDGAKFEGGNLGKQCASSLAGASYIKTDAAISEESMLTWDRGYGANDGQVWGAVAGPYRFDKRSQGASSRMRRSLLRSARIAFVRDSNHNSDDETVFACVRK